MIILTTYHVNGIFFLTSPCKSVVMCVCVCVGGGGGGVARNSIKRRSKVKVAL